MSLPWCNKYAKYISDCRVISRCLGTRRLWPWQGAVIFFLLIELLKLPLLLPVIQQTNNDDNKDSCDDSNAFNLVVHVTWCWWWFRCVTITPYLSRDTTYCYRHCKGISHFPLLPYHPSPRPMPDWITSASWPSFASYRLIRLMPWTPSHILPHGQPHSFAISIPFPLTSSWRMTQTQTWTLFLSYDIIAYWPSYNKTITLDPDHTYGHSLLAHSPCMMDITLISDILYNAMTHLGLCRWLILALPYDDIADWLLLMMTQS